ncbi:MAG: antibiotic biosynthesis monooxygenase family protein [Henriciella sp.]
MILRQFEVQAKPGCAGALLEKFATSSAAVVQDQPGNLGYFFGRGVAGEEDRVMFTSVWTDLDAVKARFGAHWQDSFLPEGYDVLIQACSVRHVEIDAGWAVDV